MLRQGTNIFSRQHSRNLTLISFFCRPQVIGFVTYDFFIGGQLSNLELEFLIDNSSSITQAKCLTMKLLLGHYF